jgi:hypothetical protein
MLRVSFSSMTKARAAVNVLEAYGHSAKQVGEGSVEGRADGLSRSTSVPS